MGKTSFLALHPDNYHSAHFGGLSALRTDKYHSALVRRAFTTRRPPSDLDLSISTLGFPPRVEKRVSNLEAVSC